MGRSIHSTDPERLTAFFVRYGESLASGDLPAISSCYALLALVVRDDGV